MFHHIKKLISPFFSREPKFYTVPFGPIKGMKLFTTFKISPRMMLGIDETWVVKTSNKYIKKGDTVYDLGAHIGYTSLIFSKLVGTHGQVHSFELLPSVARNYLAKNVEANNLTNVKVHAIGLADKKENINIFIGDSMMGTLNKNGYNSHLSEICQIDTLDNFIAEHRISPPKLIKIDVERSEITCLRGAMETIKKFRPTLIIEFHSIELLEAGFKLLTELGYQLQSEKEIITDSYFAKIKSFYGNTLATPKP
ncbi:MAG: FkbM family methyltransferase [Flavobacteriales bacterium]|nr:MAG: FkbM family methyltransferase [Flavobacteriales bacterium]